MKQLYAKDVTTATVTINAHQCGNCGVIWGLGSDYEQRRREDGKTFYCPNGCPRAYVESEIDRLKKQVKAANDNRDYWVSRHDQERAATEEERKAHASTKGKLTKLKKRVDNGVCPECHRTFPNLASHMADKHAANEYAKHKGESNAR